MKKSILLFFFLALHTTIFLASSRNQHNNSQSTNSQQADSQVTELDDEADDAVVWLFSSQSQNNQPLQDQNDESQEDAQINDGYDDGFQQYLHQPTPSDSQPHAENFQAYNNNLYVVFNVVSQDAAQNPRGMQRTVRIQPHGQWPYPDRNNEMHVVSQETNNSSQNN